MTLIFYDGGDGFTFGPIDFDELFGILQNAFPLHLVFDGWGPLKIPPSGLLKQNQSLLVVVVVVVGDEY